MKLHGRHALIPSCRFKQVRRVRDINKYHQAKIDLSLDRASLSDSAVASRRVASTRRSHGSALLYAFAGVRGCEQRYMRGIDEFRL